MCQWMYRVGMCVSGRKGRYVSVDVPCRYVCEWLGRVDMGQWIDWCMYM